jgi:alpha-tubulin suppressor-like RCC1 family protein
VRKATWANCGVRQMLPSIVALTIIAAGLTAVPAVAATPVSLVAWGNDTVSRNDTVSQGRVPVSAGPAKGIAVSDEHSLTVRTDGTVVAWGWNGYGQTSVPTGLSGVVAVAAGGDTSGVLTG